MVANSTNSIDVFARTLSALGFVVSLFSFFFTYYDFQRQAQPLVYTTTYIGESPTLESERDAKYLLNHELKTNIAPSRWVQIEADHYQAGATKRYLFFVIINRGPGRVRDFSIDAVGWPGQSGPSEAEAAALKASLFDLEPHHLFAVLVDIVDLAKPETTILPSLPDTITFGYRYTDDLKRETKDSHFFPLQQLRTDVVARLGPGEISAGVAVATPSPPASTPTSIQEGTGQPSATLTTVSQESTIQPSETVSGVPTSVPPTSFPRSTNTPQSSNPAFPAIGPVYQVTPVTLPGFDPPKPPNPLPLMPIPDDLFDNLDNFNGPVQNSVAR